MQPDVSLATCCDVEELSALVVDTAFHLHKELGPGLMEHVYEAVLAQLLQRRGLEVAQHVSVPFVVAGLHFDEGLHVDLLVNKVFLVELKSVEALAPVHYKQVLTYLRLLKLPVGLMINFGAATFKEGVTRIVNGHRDTANSRLRVNRGR
jgi:iron complex transport system substrate-binding protein